jgi:asparagine synthase (glutamine-hydrolysing)
MLHDLRGMFAFAIWDNRKKELFLARDPFGIKPLYYADDGKTIRVASQVKALLKGTDINTTPEPAGHVGFFLWGHVPEPYTFYKGISALPAGSYMTIRRDGGKTMQSYCRITDIFVEAEHSRVWLSREEMEARLREAMLDSVRHHLIADVPVGIFLSSGLDSTTLTALAAEIAPANLNTITLGFREYLDTSNDETPLAILVAGQYNTTQHTIWVSKDDFQLQREHLLHSMDQPSIDGVNTYFVCQAAKKAGLKVWLSGLGGDELFGSYPSFRQVPKMVRFFGPFQKSPYLGKAFRKVSAPFLRHMTSPKYAGLLEYGGSFSGAYLLRRGMYMPWELPKLLDGDLLKEGWQELQTLLRLDETINGLRSDHLRVSALETCWYMRNQLLRDADWASMAHLIEMRLRLKTKACCRNYDP